MTTITWPTVAALGLVFGLIGWLAYLNDATLLGPNQDQIK